MTVALPLLAAAFWGFVIMKKFAVVLFAISMSAGVANAKVMHPHKYYPVCADGMVKASCVCKSAAASHMLCKAGQWCHTFEGVCHQ
jgi:hypothetical protein